MPTGTVPTGTVPRGTVPVGVSPAALSAVVAVVSAAIAAVVGIVPAGTAVRVLVAGAAGAAAGPWMRAAIVRHSVPGPGARNACPRCAAALGGAGPVPASGRAHSRWACLWWLGVARLPGSGRAPCCGARIGPPAAVVEIVAGSACVVVAVARPGPAALLGCWIVVCGVVLVAVDAAVHRLPAPLTAATAAGAGAALVPTLAHDPPAVARAVVAAVVAGAALLVLRLLTRGGIGGGDCALAPALGAAMGRDGWVSLALCGLAAAVLGAVHAVVAAAVAGRARGVEVPFGPSMVGAALAVVTVTGPHG
ncbi:putative type IV peptidase [Pseudonocardia sp. N23]|nr:putative type IV peptidase [Pseudonocardia sp. N23]